MISTILDNQGVRRMWMKFVRNVKLGKLGRERDYLNYRARQQYHQIAKTPAAPETPEDFWHEAREERLADMARQQRQWEMEELRRFRGW